MNRDPVDRQAGRRRLQGERPAGGCAEQMGAPAGRLDDSGEIVDLALDRVGLGVAAVAAPTPPIRDGGELIREVLAERKVLGTIVQSAADQDHDGSVVAESVVADGGAVGRCHMRHVLLLHQVLLD